ncbi:sugar isomerase domain-containing protein [Frondihabitans sp. PAMC 28766]|uniref:sugar isomerase domain-containing protein n=1 Tax=Frondihabitans sp. PAMC 28766 TaxID=1795630 RepID=UPI00194DEDD8|nr:sugar isomerase domain-containing protein [Frondihabitans sp. PAMC 28766]
MTNAHEILDAIENTQMPAIETAAAIAAESIGSGSVMFASGTGHSRMAVEELFPRYGSFPGFYPLVELSTTFHTQVVGNNGQRQAMFLERVEGLAAEILANFEIAPPQSMILFSASGQNAVAIELAMIARAAGLPVVGVTSLAEYAASAPRHSSGKKLADVVDLVIDLCTPVGDSVCALEGHDTPVGPSTTLAGTAIVNTLKVETAKLLSARGELPSVLTSAAVVGQDRSRELFEDAYLDQAERSAAVLRTRRLVP